MEARTVDLPPLPGVKLAMVGLPLRCRPSAASTHVLSSERAVTPVLGARHSGPLLSSGLHLPSGAHSLVTKE